jgi:hypothetical protein
VPRGGARPGAGRKKGSVTKATVYRQEMLARAASEGISPLEVMMTAMRQAWAANDHEKAVEYAVSAAPYVHPRLAAVEHSGNEDKPLAIEVVSGVTRVIDAITHGSDSDSAPRPTH